jgi:tetratricopeptide (TPR) repeat protein
MMRALARLLWLALCVAALPFPVLAADDDDDDLAENTLTRGKTTPASGSATSATDAEIIAWMNRPYDADSYRAADALKADVAMIDACREAVDLIYQRKYKDARKKLDGLTAKYPTSGIGPFGVVLLYQALMFENFDMRYEKQYQVTFTEARKQLDAGLAIAGNEAFENFLYAGLMAIDAIHSLRKEQYVTALDRALEAMKRLETTKKLAPEFPDAALGDGMYLYWRSVVTQQSKLLPDFPDRRAEGLALMQKAEREAIFLGPAASLALAFSHIEERDLRAALDRVLYIRLAYPDNVINNMTIGRIYTSARRYGEAIRLFDEILVDAPDNQRVHYFRGVALARATRYPEALKAYQTYLGFKDIPKEAKGQTYYRIGALYARQEDKDKAKAYFEQAIAASGNEAAKRALDKLKSGS